MHLDTGSYIALGFLGAVFAITAGVFGFLLTKMKRKH
jgi:hypothetical protein